MAECNFIGLARYEVQMAYVRFQSAEPNAEGRHPGIFGLVNGLARIGKLSIEEEEFRRANNAWYEANCPDPSTINPRVYDHCVNPGSVAWFKASARILIDRVEGYLEILSAHGVRCDRLTADQPPGQVIYEDDYQIVVVPIGA